MKRILLIGLSLPLIGCVEFKKWEVEAAQEFCTDHGGLQRIYNIVDNAKAECLDGAVSDFLRRPMGSR